STGLPLKRSEQEKDLVFDSLSQNIMYQDLDMRVQWANHVAADNAGLKLNDMLGRHCYEIWHGSNTPCVGCPIETTLQTGRVCGGESTTPDGRMWLLQANPVRDPDARIVGAVEISTDITERKRAEMRLAAANAELEAVFQALPDLYFRLDSEGTYLDVRAGQTADLWAPREELLGKRVRDLLPPEAVHWIEKAIHEALATDSPISVEYSLPLPAGEQIFEARVMPFPEKQVIFVVRNITERRQREEALRIAKEELEGRVAERTGDLREAIKQLQRELAERERVERCLRLNEARLEALIRLNQMAGESLRTLADFALEEGVRLTESKIGHLAFADESESVLTLYSGSRAAADGGRVKHPPMTVRLDAGGPWGEVVRRRRPVITNDYSAADLSKRGLHEGHAQLVRHLCVPVFDGDRIVVVAAVANKAEPYNESDARQLMLIMNGMWQIISRKQLEEQLLRSQRLETAGRIAAQVAHDFNNLLGPMVAYPELIKMKLAPDDPAVPYCDSMLEAAQLMADLNSDMLALSRRGLLEQQPVSLNQLVEQAVRQMGDYPATLRLELALASDLLPVSGSPAQISRMLSNLLVNAREALHDIGLLAVKTENIYVERPFGRYSRVETGEYVKLSVADTGCGIAPEIQDKIFDTFFTTKQVAGRRGCGLGLSIVQAVVEDHHGYIDLESEIGKGTTFTVYLPIHRAPDEEASTDGLQGGTETILVVDDDQIQRGVSTALLETLGYQVRTASSGEEAVEFLRSHSVDLLMLDMIIEDKIDGTETYRRVLEVRPGQRAIVVSGYAESDRVREALALGVGAYLRKPLTIVDLAKAVRAELDR
ncbi:MAG TPA: PAS domain-containing protein, partial [Chloroflexota bacterium]|nr:PAS domain-containing protein [Chloroflexota bacterium]